MESEFTIDFFEDGDGYKDIVFRTSSNSVVIQTDSYYFFEAVRAFEGISDNDIKNNIKIKNLICKILDYWTDEIKTPEFGIRFLPIDFYDECIGCFRVNLEVHDVIHFQYGFTSKYSAWNIMPSEAERFNLITNEDFKITRRSPEFSMKLNDVFKSIDKIKENLECK